LIKRRLAHQEAWQYVDGKELGKQFGFEGRGQLEREVADDLLRVVPDAENGLIEPALIPHAHGRGGDHEEHRYDQRKIERWILQMKR
jgi:hypothetical protein